jgi:DNA polymerase-1
MQTYRTYDTPVGEIKVYLIDDDVKAEWAVEQQLRGSEKIIGFDTETTSLDPYSGELRLVQIGTPDGRAFVFDCFKIGSYAEIRLRHLIEEPYTIKVGHNLKFDIKWVTKHLSVENFGLLFDTMTAAQLLAFGDHRAGFSLAKVIPRFLDGIELDKSEQKSNWGNSELSEDQIKYAAIDCVSVLRLRETMIPQLQSTGQMVVAKLEFDAIEPVAKLELNGFFLDKERWLEQEHNSYKKMIESGDAMTGLFSASALQQSLFEGAPVINLGSPIQMIRALEQHGVPVPVDNKGNKTTRDFWLMPLAEQYPVIQHLLDFREASKAYSSYGAKFLENINPITGRIHCNFNNIGALTGRFACYDPNLQQVPKDEGFRRSFRAEEGNVLVIADYSQIELRILAEFSGDNAYIEAFKAGHDLHKALAAIIFRKPIEEVMPKERGYAKNLNFGIAYGIGAKRLAMQCDCSVEEAKKIISDYYKACPYINTWLIRAAIQATTQFECRTASGRLVRFKRENDLSDTERNGKNSPIQGSSADILKRALRLIHDELSSSHKLVHIVHDEVILEVPESEAQEAASFLESKMISAGEEVLKIVPCKVETVVSKDWVKD